MLVRQKSKHAKSLKYRIKIFKKQQNINEWFVGEIFVLDIKLWIQIVRFICCLYDTR